MRYKLIRSQWLHKVNSHLCLVYINNSYVVCFSNKINNLSQEEIDIGIRYNGEFITLYKAFECYKSNIKKLEEGIYYYFYCNCPICGKLNANCICQNT